MGTRKNFLDTALSQDLVIIVYSFDIDSTGTSGR